MKFTSRIITNRISDLTEADFSKGEIILIDKPSGLTSFQVVNKIRKITGEKKVGHSGTLDSSASGLMIICTGKKTKELEQFINSTKTYEGIIRLGLKSDSMDLETDLIEKPLPKNLDEKKILSLRDEFLGEIEQTPPMYSAVKINGKKLYNLARKGKTIERIPRKIFIEKFEIEKINLPDIRFTITCSKGTYIRVIANDFGDRLGCGGILADLRRTRIGNFDISDALKLNEFSSLKSSAENFVQSLFIEQNS